MTRPQHPRYAAGDVPLSVDAGKGVASEEALSNAASAAAQRPPHRNETVRVEGFFWFQAARRSGRWLIAALARSTDTFYFGFTRFSSAAALP